MRTVLEIEMPRSVTDPQNDMAHRPIWWISEKPRRWGGPLGWWYIKFLLTVEPFQA